MTDFYHLGVDPGQSIDPTAIRERAQSAAEELFRRRAALSTR